MFGYEYTIYKRWKMNSLITKVIYIILLLISLALVSWQTVRPLNPPMRKIEKFKRSLFIAIGAATGVYSGIILIYLFEGNNTMDEWSRTSYLGLICLIIPFFFAAFIGSYLNFGVLTMLENQKIKILRKKN
jgi:hypothetical protein